MPIQSLLMENYYPDKKIGIIIQIKNIYDDNLSEELQSSGLQIDSHDKNYVIGSIHVCDVKKFVINLKNVELSQKTKFH